MRAPADRPDRLSPAPVYPNKGPEVKESTTFCLQSSTASDHAYSLMNAGENRPQMTQLDAD
jgi:hypothetical protein